MKLDLFYDNHSTASNQYYESNSTIQNKVVIVQRPEYVLNYRRGNEQGVSIEICEN